MDLIHKLYTDLNSPVCFSNADALFREANRLDPSITRRQVIDYLEGNSTYTLHHERRVKFNRRRIIPRGYFTDMQADLADFQKLARYNNGFRYLLVAVEVLSRKAFAAGVKSKKAIDMKAAFNEIFAKMPALPWVLFTDRGSEFDSREMRSFYDAKDVLKKSAENPETKAAMAERMIKTIKHRLYKYFTHNRTLTWTDAVPPIVAAINNSINRMTGMKPNDFNFENSTELWEKFYSDAFAHARKSKLKVGDVVRVSRVKGAFSKGYLPTFSNLTYRIRHVKKGKPHTYLLEDQKGWNIEKKWYREEITPATHGSDLMIEKVLRTRINKKTKEREYLIKWVDEPVDSASWLSEKDVILTQ